MICEMVASIFYVSLDDDGSLATYCSRVKGYENDNYDNDDDLVRMISRWWNDLVSGDQQYHLKQRQQQYGDHRKYLKHNKDISDAE